jgi:transposase-like protein
MKRPKVVSTEIKRRAVERVAAGEAASRVAADLKINRQRIYEWQEQVRQGGLEALRGPGRPRKGALDGPPLRSAILNEGAAARRRIAELERKIGEQQADLDFFRQALRHVKARQQAAGVSGKPRSSKSSGR